MVLVVLWQGVREEHYFTHHAFLEIFAPQFLFSIRLVCRATRGGCAQTKGVGSPRVNFLELIFTTLQIQKV